MQRMKKSVHAVEGTRASDERKKRRIDARLFRGISIFLVFKGKKEDRFSFDRWCWQNERVETCLTRGIFGSWFERVFIDANRWRSLSSVKRCRRISNSDSFGSSVRRKRYQKNAVGLNETKRWRALSFIYRPQNDKRETNCRVKRGAFSRFD